MIQTLSKAGIAAAAGLVIALSAPQASAQEISESHEQAARAAIASIAATESYDTILPAVAETLRAQLIVNNPDLETQINDVLTEEAIALAARRADLEREAAQIYARAFREEDLRAIAEFYNTDAGRALLANGPIVAREVAGAANVWRRGVERDLANAVGNRLAETNPREGLVVPQEAPAEAPAAE